MTNEHWEQQITNQQVGLVVKAALDHNATLVAFASYWYGNVDSKKASKAFKDGWDKIDETYTKQVQSIMEWDESKIDESK